MPARAALSTADRRSARQRPTTYRQVMRHFPTAVAVLTVAAHDGPRGMTANSITSLSLEPELLLACVRRQSRFAASLRATGEFAVNVLQERQENIARWFASPARLAAADEFSGVPWRSSPDNGQPVLAGAAIAIGCHTADLLRRGDHLVVIGEITGCAVNPDARPLLWHRGSYHQIGGPASAGPCTGRSAISFPALRAIARNFKEKCLP